MTTIPISQWDEYNQHQAVEFGRWDNDNLYIRCGCGWVGLRRDQGALHVVWDEHIRDHRALDKKLGRNTP